MTCSAKRVCKPWALLVRRRSCNLFFLSKSCLLLPSYSLSPTPHHTFQETSSETYSCGNFKKCALLRWALSIALPQSSPRNTSIQVRMLTLFSPCPLTCADRRLCYFYFALKGGQKWPFFPSLLKKLPFLKQWTAGPPALLGSQAGVITA